MIGGEFDLSVGSVVGAAGMGLMLLTVHAGWPFWPAVGLTLLACLAVGIGNGYLVVRTRLPSFLVTLSSLFVLRGLTVGGSRLLTGRTQLGGLREVEGYEVAHHLFASTPGLGIRAVVLWWALWALAGMGVLGRTVLGNWILATGGDPDAARSAGVPVARVKIALFALTALTAGVVAVIQAVQFGGADALRGQMMEFRAIVAVVIGGTLLTGGAGSVLGVVFGTLLFGIVQQGLVMAGVDADWFQVFLGAMLLSVVLFNRYARTRLAPQP